MKMDCFRWLPAFVALSLTACSGSSTTSGPGGEGDADSAGGADKSSWFEPGFFLEFSPTSMVTELYADQGGGAMHAVTVQSALRPSTSLADYLARLANDAELHDKLTTSQAAGAQVVVQLHPMPRWLSADPTNNTLPCANQPLWPAWSTRAPAADMWDEWEQVVEETVLYLTTTLGYDHLWFQLWEEPDGSCFWTDTEAAYLDLFAHTASAARRANAAARLGGPGTEGPRGLIEPSATPLVRALIDRSATDGIALDFVAYHYFGFSPHVAKVVAEEVDGWLDDAGYPDTQLLITSYNPLESDRSDYWPAPPTPSPTGRTWEQDTEVGAAYVPAFSAAMEASGRRGYHTLYQLDDHDTGQDFECDSCWAARTAYEQNGIRKAMYHGMTLMGRIPTNLLATNIEDPRAGSDGALGPLGALAGVEGNEVSLLVWSFIAAPEREANAVVMAAGYPDGLGTWPISALEPFFAGTEPVSSVTSDAAEQVVLERAKRVFERQRDLVTRRRALCIAADGLDAAAQVYLVDSTHNNAYRAYLDGGLGAAISAGQLGASPEVLVRNGDCLEVELEPYAVLGVRFTASDRPGRLVVRAVD